MEKFKTDGCSGFMSLSYSKYKNLEYFLLQKEKTKDFDKLPWHNDCVEHDYVYYGGGTWKDRKIADTELMRAVAKRGYPYWAIIMYLAVRFGGHPLYPLPWRWEFKYKYNYKNIKNILKTYYSLGE